MKALRLMSLCAALSFGIPHAVLCQQTDLDGFTVLIGGEWVGDNGGVQTFRWGLGRLTVHAQAFFFDSSGQRRQVGEGWWYLDPRTREIRGIHTAIEMPVFLFDYSTTWDGATMRNEITTYGDQGGEYRETWEFLDRDTYRWTLYRKTGRDEFVQVMTDLWRRVESHP